MKMILDKIQSSFSQTILKIIEHNFDNISLIKRFPSDPSKARIYGVSLEISPWFNYFYLELIPEENASDFLQVIDCADFGISLSRNRDNYLAEQKSTIELMSQFYNGELPESENLSEFNRGHLLFITAAKALLDIKVTAKLQESGIDALLPEENFFTTFSYHVYNRDRTLKLNYCEYLLLSGVIESSNA